MATGMARGAAARGKRVAFGDGNTISWDQYSEAIFQRNPNIAPPHSKGAPDLEWIDYRKGNRHYNRHDPLNNRWIWNMDFRPTPGELFFSSQETAWALRQASRHVVLEPNVAAWKTSSANKRWSPDRYNEVARQLRAFGFDMVQFIYGDGYRSEFARAVRPPRFRYALASLARAALYVGPEGGMHHAAAALGVPGVVLFGGFIPPVVTGYETHTNLTGGAEACGSLTPCKHCADAMAAISADEVVDAALAYLKDDAA